MLAVPVLLYALSAAVVSVSAHGYVQQLLTGSVYYTGYLPDPGGENGTQMVANANAGSEITFFWTPWGINHKGPVSTYMASCNGPCSSFSTLNAKWFKIDASGYENNEWGSSKLIAANNTWTIIIPAGLASGQYLMRNEIVALHFVGAPGGLPQFYPSCTQLNVMNGGSDTPTPSELVDINEIYEGIQWPDVWLPIESFTIPGPNVVSFPSGSDTGSGLTNPLLPLPSPSPSPSAGTNVVSNRANRHVRRMMH